MYQLTYNQLKSMHAVKKEPIYWAVILALLFALALSSMWSFSKKVDQAAHQEATFQIPSISNGNPQPANGKVQ